jgi:hypothetical protein
MIDIGSVLLKFDDTYNEETMQVKNYGIKFVTSEGRIRTMQCRKNVRSPRQPRSPNLIATRSRRKGMFNLQRHGTMLVHDMNIGEPRTVKVSQIFAFRDFNATDWHNVRH